MLARALAGTTVGVCGQVIHVEVDLAPGLPGVTIVGLPDASIQESRERIRAAIRNSGLKFPLKRITVNLAPAVMRKEGVAFDLAIACGILAASEQLAVTQVPTVLCGELGLDGSVRPVRGVLALAADLARSGHRELIVPEECAAEAAMVPGLTIRRARTLADVVRHFAGEPLEVQRPGDPAGEAGCSADTLDLADVRGQPTARRALEVAAAGHHNLLLTGPPGSGKTMLANRLASILPPVTFEESLEITRVHSVAGQLTHGRHWVSTRPVRAPHHTASDIALVGGGPRARPGEVSLAHRGVLFLDELPEFRRPVLEALRQPLVDGAVTISRASASYRYPADFFLVATMNPCPCGHRGDAARVCRCSDRMVDQYRSRISGPLMDRLDLVVDVPRVHADHLRAPPGECSSTVRERVLSARARQLARLALPAGALPVPNARLTSAQTRRFCRLDPDAETQLDEHARAGLLSARAYEKVLRVALTLSDLEGADHIRAEHVAEAVSYRAATLPQESLAA